ncbi:hypothetical protein E2C01_020577 [Portunus trituberculatus]|uniref:Uncharacterized protein n=1 Tax=Portunus trituberculatus TaxID=210409 RepID=A0A5B7E241_PORTR|nr:hypothetical protein [Portunus trituberculatus]
MGSGSEEFIGIRGGGRFVWVVKTRRGAVGIGSGVRIGSSVGIVIWSGETGGEGIVRVGSGGVSQVRAGRLAASEEHRQVSRKCWKRRLSNTVVGAIHLPEHLEVVCRALAGGDGGEEGEHQPDAAPTDGRNGTLHVGGGIGVVT